MCSDFRKSRFQGVGLLSQSKCTVADWHRFAVISEQRIIAFTICLCIIWAWLLQPQAAHAQSPVAAPAVNADTPVDSISVTRLIDEILGPVELNFSDSPDVVRSSPPKDIIAKADVPSAHTQRPVEMKLSDGTLGIQIPTHVEEDSGVRIAKRDARNRRNSRNSRNNYNRSNNDASMPNRGPAQQTPGSKSALTDFERKRQIARCLAIFYQLPVDTEKWRPWTIMHGLLPYGQQSKVVYQNRTYNAVEYLCYNAIGNETYMMDLADGELTLKVGPGVQGHEGQFLAMLAQADVPQDAKIQIQGKKFTVADLIEYEKQGCRAGTELTFKLIGLSHYLESDEVWDNSLAEPWNIERLIFEELKQPINGAACGGTHRLMGLSYAVEQRRQQDLEIDGQWARARHFVSQYQEYAMRYQNHDGSFSTNWFVTQEADIDSKKRLYTTGHIVEWLSFSLPEENLTDPRLLKGIDYLTKLMLTSPALDLEIGPKGHALHALRIYERRAYGTNSNVEEITPRDLAFANRALKMQEHMIPSFDSQFGTVPSQGVSYPGNNNISPGGGRRGFRRR